jgi:hypothetical protein
MQKYSFGYSFTFTVFHFYDAAELTFMVAFPGTHSAVQYAAVYGMAEKGKTAFL